METIRYITDAHGKTSGLLIDLDAARKLLKKKADIVELMEDIEDLAAVAERREEPTVSHEDLLVELKRDGLI